MKRDAAITGTITPKAKVKPITVEEYLRYEFSDEELSERSKSLAMNIQRQTQAEEEQKAAASQFKERIESYKASIGKLSRDINNGWEMRNIVCFVDHHKPVVGTKRIVRSDTGALVAEIAMTPGELQQHLFPEDSAK